MKAAYRYLFLLISSSTSALLHAQCGYPLCTYADNVISRINGNTVRGQLNTYTTGPNSPFFAVRQRGWMYKDGVLLATSPIGSWSSYGGSVTYTFSNTSLPGLPSPPATDPGPWTYSIQGFHESFCPAFYCGVDVYYPPYTDGGNGYRWGPNHVVQRPTISGLCCGNSFWNLGPGTADPQPTVGGGSYRQSVPLTFQSNCQPSTACTATPQWSLTTTNQQAQLSSTSGSSVTLQKGSQRGNCARDTHLRATINGFSTVDIEILVNSPLGLVNSGYGGVPASTTGPNSGGYTTYWSLAVTDACSPSQALLAIPMNETFANLALQNGATGYGLPPGMSVPYWDYTSWDTDYTFIDNIGQAGASQSPPVTFTVAFPPYPNNTVYLSGNHYFYAGTTSSAQGWQVYSGLIRYFKDHGDNVP